MTRDELSYWQRFVKRNYPRRTILRGGGAASLAAGLALAGCGDDDDGEPEGRPTGAATPEGGPRSGGTLNMATTADAAHLDFALRIDFPMAMAVNQVYSKLTRYKIGPDTDPQELTLEGETAASWEVTDDAMQVTFKLKPGVMFHNKPPVNGRELVAEDIKNTVEYLLTATPPFHKDAFEWVDTIETPDDHTVIFKNQRPFGFLVDYTADAYAGNIMATEVLDQYGDLKTVAIGAGPQMLEEYQRGTGFTFKRHPEYHEEGLPYLDGIWVPIMPDASAQLSAFRAGDLDFAGGGPVLAKTLRQSNPDLPFRAWREAQIPGIDPNSNKPPFNDVRVRRAISLGINREELLDSILLGEGFVNGVMTAAFEDYALPASDLPYCQYKPEEAKQLLEAAGFGNGLDITMLTTPAYGEPYASLGEAAISQLRKIGINITLQPLPYAEWIDRAYVKGDYDVAYHLMSPRPPVDYQTYLFHSENGGNWLRTQDSDMDELIVAARGAATIEERTDALHEFQRYFDDQAYRATLPWQLTYSFYQPRVHDYYQGVGTTFFATLFQRIWLET